MPFDRQASSERVDLLIPGMTCAGCMTRIERCLQKTPGVLSARACGPAIGRGMPDDIACVTPSRTRRLP